MITQTGTFSVIGKTHAKVKRFRVKVTFYAFEFNIRPWYHCFLSGFCNRPQVFLPQIFFCTCQNTQQTPLTFLYIKPTRAALALIPNKGRSRHECCEPRTSQNDPNNIPATKIRYSFGE